MYVPMCFSRPRWCRESIVFIRPSDTAISFEHDDVECGESNARQLCAAAASSSVCGRATTTAAATAAKLSHISATAAGQYVHVAQYVIIIVVHSLLCFASLCVCSFRFLFVLRARCNYSSCSSRIFCYHFYFILPVVH